MFIPNLYCTITKAGSVNVYGEEQPGLTTPARCAIVKLLGREEKTSVRADSSASRGNAQEVTADAVLLFPPNTVIGMDDKITVVGQTLRVSGIWPRHDLRGRLDHYQVEAMKWA